MTATTYDTPGPRPRNVDKETEVCVMCLTRAMRWLIGGVAVLVVGFFALNLFSGSPESTSGRQELFSTSTPFTGPTAPFLLSANIPPPRGFDLFTISDFLTKNGATLFVHSVDWDKLEPSPRQYATKDMVTAAFQGLVPKYPFKGTVLIIKMIDSNTRTMPADLRGKPFDNPAVLERFLAMLHAVAISPGVAERVDFILLGNEVDGYFVAHPKELSGFMTLLKKSIDQLHQDLPGVKVGTITTADSLKRPDLFRTLTQYSDYVNYTYYPLGAHWQMRPVSDAAGDLEQMAAAAGDKWFGFTELGYSTSPKAGSSEAQQAEFMRAVFQSLDKYENQVAYVNWAGVSDTPDDVCQTYAKQQGLPDKEAFCGYGSYTGLRTYDNQPKPSWDIFVQEMAKRGSN